MLEEIVKEPCWFYMVWFGLLTGFLFWYICKFSNSTAMKTTFKVVASYFWTLSGYSLVLYLIGKLL